MKYFRLFLLITFTLSVYLYIYENKNISYIDNKIYDYIYGLKEKYNHEAKANHVVVVDIDEKSLNALGQWPWSRIVISEIFRKIREQNPASIGLDILFPEYDKTSPKQMTAFYKKYFSLTLKIDGLSKELMDNDKIFADEISKTDTTLPVYLSNQKQSSESCYIPKIYRDLQLKLSNRYKYMLCNIDILQKSAKRIGFINSRVDEDGRLRRVGIFKEYQDYVIPFFGMANLMNVDDIKVDKNIISVLNHTFRTDKKYELLLSFSKKYRYKTVSAIDLLKGDIPAGIFRGKFVLLGASAVGLHDSYRVYGDRNFPGVYVHATFIDNILNDDTMYQPDFFRVFNYILSFLISLFLVFLLYKRAYFKTVVVFLSTVCLSVFLSYFFLKNGIYVSLSYFLTPLLVNFFFINLFFVFLYYEEKVRFNKTLTTAHTSVIDSMALVAETRDAETGAHIKRTKEYMKVISLYLYKHNRFPDIITPKYMELIYRATPLHDIGKVGIPDSILKKEDRLTKDEFEIMKTHTILGKNIIQNAMKNSGNNQFLKIAYNIAYYHHERWDGEGYPNGLKGKEIPLEARMMALCDVYDALISRRCYKLPIGYEESEEIILDGAGTHFDPVVVDAFLKLKDEFVKIAKRTQY